MYGNRPGWVLSALLVIGFAAALFMLESAKGTTAPTGEFGPAAMGPLRFDVDPRTVVPAAAAGEAGPLYRDAIKAYRADEATYDRLARGDRAAIAAADPATLPGLAKLLAATPMRSADIFAVDPSAVVGYRSDPPPLAALLQLGRASATAGLLKQAGDPALARRLYSAAFALGANLAAERLTYPELQGGLELMSLADAGLKSYAAKAGDSDLAGRVGAFEAARAALYDQQIAPVWRAVSSIDPGVRNKYAGDVFRLAGKGQGQGAAERVWRVEALLKLGRLRYSAARVGDKAGAARVLKSVASGAADPAVKLAAEKGRDLTLRDFRLLR